MVLHAGHRGVEFRSRRDLRGGSTGLGIGLGTQPRFDPSHGRADRFCTRLRDPLFKGLCDRGCNDLFELLDIGHQVVGCRPNSFVSGGWADYMNSAVGIKGKAAEGIYSTTIFPSMSSCPGPQMMSHSILCSPGSYTCRMIVAGMRGWMGSLTPRLGT